MRRRQKEEADLPAATDPEAITAIIEFLGRPVCTLKEAVGNILGGVPDAWICMLEGKSLARFRRAAWRDLDKATLAGEIDRFTRKAEEDWLEVEAAPKSAVEWTLLFHTKGVEVPWLPLIRDAEKIPAECAGVHRLRTQMAPPVPGPTSDRDWRSKGGKKRHSNTYASEIRQRIEQRWKREDVDLTIRTQRKVFTDRMLELYCDESSGFNGQDSPATGDIKQLEFKIRNQRTIQNYIMKFAR